MEKRNEVLRTRILIVPFIVVFCILGTVVFFISKKISREMSESAINNLSESLDLISNTIEVILKKEVEFQKLLSQEIAGLEKPEDFVLSYDRNDTMVKLSLILSGETEGISNTGEVFAEKDLDFSWGKTVEDLPLSKSYVNSMGTWAYTIKCPVIRNKIGRAHV